MSRYDGDNLRTNLKAMNPDEAGLTTGLRDKTVPHYYSWSCGCRTRITKEAFEVEYCKEDCPILAAVLEETKNK